jgi:hypothetical protein
LAFDATVLRVLIASPSDVKDERSEIPNILRRWNNEHGEDKKIVLLPMGWETESYPLYDPKANGPQNILNEQIVQKADIVIAVFWTRLGTSTEGFPSGTIEEIERSAANGKPVAVYFSTKDMPYNVDLEQASRVRQYKETLQGKALTGEYRTLAEFRELLRDNLTPLVDIAFQRLGSGPKSVQRQNANNWSETDISNLVTPPRTYKTETPSFDRRFINQINTLIRKWEAIKPGEHKNVHPDEGKKFMEIFETKIDELYGMLSDLGMTEQKEKLSEAQQLIVSFRRHRLLLDGGKSYRDFWELGSRIVTLVEEVVDTLRNEQA